MRCREAGEPLGTSRRCRLSTWRLSRRRPPQSGDRFENHFDPAEMSPHQSRKPSSCCPDINDAGAVLAFLRTRAGYRCRGGQTSLARCRRDDVADQEQRLENHLRRNRAASRHESGRARGCRNPHRAHASRAGRLEMAGRRTGGRLFAGKPIVLAPLASGRFEAFHGAPPRAARGTHSIASSRPVSDATLMRQRIAVAAAGMAERRTSSPAKLNCGKVYEPTLVLCCPPCIDISDCSSSSSALDMTARTVASSHPSAAR